MSIVRQLAKGVTVSWTGTLFSIMAGFVMAPFLVHHLGVAGYGIWVLMQSVISYMYLMELGLGTAVVRFVSRDYAQSNHGEVSRIVSAAIWVRLWSAVIALLIVWALSSLLPHMFSVPTQYLSAAQTGLLLLGISFAAFLVFSIFSGVLMAIGRFDQLAGFDLFETTLTTIGLIPVVRSGFGIIGMAVWYLFSIVITRLGVMIWCLRQYPQLKISLKGIPDRGLLRELWQLSLYILGYNVADQFISYSDNIVVGAFVSTPAVAYFAIAGRMVQYLRKVASGIQRFFMPLASAFEAQNRFESLKTLQLNGTQVVMIVTLPMITTLFVRGGTFINLWIGYDFQQNATPVLRILIATAALVMTNVSVNSLAITFGKQRQLAVFTLLEGIANVVISITLAKSIGLVGVAIGTAIPSVFMQIFVWPKFICNLIRIKKSHYFLEVWLRPALAVLPFALASYAAEEYWPAHNLVQFILQTVGLLPVALVGVMVTFKKEFPRWWNALRTRQTEASVQAETYV